MELIKTFEGFLNVLNVLNMSQVTGFLKPVMGSADPGVQLSHSKMIGCHSLYGSNIDF